MADKTIGGDGQMDTEELERYLCRWCYNNGTPFTTITYSVDGGLSIKEDDGARRLYEQAFPYHDEPLLDADGNIIGIQTVANEDVPVVRGEWTYTIKKGSCIDYHVTAKCSECGWDWFSKEGVGNYSAVFSAFITNGDSRPEEVKRFLLENARANNNLNYCPNCGAKMDLEVCANE